MTMKRVLSGILIAALASAISAAPVRAAPAAVKAEQTGPEHPAPAAQSNVPLVRVTAGDHGATSRIAFNFRPDHGFRVERAGRQITVLFPETTLQFAYDEVYPRRQASRVVFAGPEARPDAAAFTLKFACECDADVALDASNRVLVQVREKGVVPDNPPPAPHGITAAATAATHAEPARPETDAPSSTHQPDPTMTAPPPIVLSRGHVPRRRPVDRRAEDGGPLNGAGETAQPAAAADMAPAPPRGVLAAHEVDRLRRSLEWAAQQGFLDKPGDIDLTASGPDSAPPPPNLVNVPQQPPVEAGHQTALSSPPNGSQHLVTASPPAEPGFTQPGQTEPRSQRTGPHRAAAANASPSDSISAPESPRPPRTPNPPPADTVAESDGPDTSGLRLENVNWTCDGPQQPPIVDWSGTDPLNRDFLRAIGKQQAAVAELPAPEAMRRMAMFYLAHGMTREALASLNSSGQPMPSLHDAMLLLIGHGDAAGTALLDASPCHSDIAVWRAALLKMRGYRKLAEWAAGNAIAPLAAFPPFPRTVLALELAEAALNQGNVDLADAYLDLVEPAPGQTVSDRVAMLQGRKALLQGHTDRANWYFSQALDGDPEIRRQTRIALIRDAVDSARPIPPWALDVMGSALFDYRGDRQLLPLALLAADVQGAMGNYPAALEELAAASRRLPEAIDRTPIMAKAKALLVGALTADSVDDATALQLFTDHGEGIGDDPISRTAAARLAERMLVAGLPSAAKRLLAPLVGQDDAQPEWRRMLAEAELRSGDPQSALQTIAPLAADPAMATLQRQALAALGQYSAAANIVANAAPDPLATAMPTADSLAAVELRWAAGDWAAAAREFAKLLADIRPDDPSAAAGDLAVKALAAAYMAGGLQQLGAQAETAVAIARATGHGDAAAALTSPPLPGNLTLPDTIAAVLSRSQQVSQIFPSMAKGS